MKYLLTLIFAFILTGCATTPNYAQQASGLSLDMTKSEVLEIMGPARKNSARKVDGKVVEEWAYWSPSRYGLTVIDNETLAGDRVTVVFIDGTVSEWGDMMSYNRIMDKSAEAQQKMLSNINYPDVNVTIEDQNKK